MNRFLLALLLALFVVPVWADVHAAASCSQIDVQSAVTAASDGDTVTVPAGTCTYTTSAAMTPSVYINNKTINLIGAGIGSTVITDSTDDGYQEVPILAQLDLGKSARISGFTFLSAVTGTDQAGIVHIAGNSATWRIDYCKFDAMTKGNGIAVASTVGGTDTFGLVDHCDFVTATGAGNFKALQLNGAGAASWGRALSMGTAGAVYIEDCTFDVNITDGYVLIDNDRGGRAVFRHNTVNGKTAVGTHGYDSGDWSNLSLEIYANLFTQDVAGAYYVISYYRGGTGLIFNNTIVQNPGTWGSFTRLFYYCACPGNPTCGHPTCTEYPCEQQPGTAPDGAGGRLSAPIYEWNNTVTGLTPYIGCANNCTEECTMIQENRDFYNQVIPFTGATGTGYGLNSSKPATCTTGVSYFSTDIGSQGTLYKCTATNTWTAYYSPYTYPHPLQNNPSGTGGRSHMRRP